MITCTFENSRIAHLRHVTVGTISINKKHEVLLVKRAPNLPRGGTFTIPGGFLERDETVEQGALRELKEETGYDGEIKALFQINDSPKRPKEDRQNVDFVFIAEITGGIETINPEVTSIYWFSKEFLPKEELFAYDHRSSILRYFSYLKKPYALPLIGNLL